MQQRLSDQLTERLHQLNDITQKMNLDSQNEIVEQVSQGHHEHSVMASSSELRSKEHICNADDKVSLEKMFVGFAKAVTKVGRSWKRKYTPKSSSLGMFGLCVNVFFFVLSIVRIKRLTHRGFYI